MHFHDTLASFPTTQILSPHFRKIASATVRFFRSGNSPIFPPRRWYESLMMSVERERRTWRRGGGGVFRSHDVIWEVGEKFRERCHAQIHTCSPFQSIYLWVLDLLLLFNIPVIRNHYALSFHRCSEIDPSWGARVHSSALFLSIPVWHPYHYPLPHFHLICLNFLNGENFPLLDSIISCTSNEEVPWRIPPD